MSTWNFLIHTVCCHLSSMMVNLQYSSNDLPAFHTALAEILSVKEVSARKLFYVHYIDCEYNSASCFTYVVIVTLGSNSQHRIIRAHVFFFYVKLLTLKVNKRLDEWVTGDRLDMKKLQFPKKEAKTPTKNGLPGSRPSSPEREVVSVIYILIYYTNKCSFQAL